MPNTQNDQCSYGKLQLVIDNDVEWFALAPDATLTDIADLFRATAGAAPCRLFSVCIFVQSAP